MGDVDPEVEEALFHRALEIQDAALRQRFLDENCGVDTPVRRRLEHLLNASSDTVAPGLQRESLFSTPLSALAARFEPGLFFEEAPGATIDKYSILRQLGQGGCGVVFLAEQLQPVRRTVALKVLRAGMDTRHVIARFEQERQMLAVLQHPNIAQILDAGTTPSGRPYFAMEFVDGPPITQFCDRHNLDLTQRLQLFVHVCHAIQHAHQKGIIHRDIKPSNILVATEGPNGAPLPKVIDFGIAKATEGQWTHHTLVTELSQIMGTPAYMSPEQAAMRSGDMDTRSDIYSLGALLYELLTGRTPFDTATLVEKGLEELQRTIREVDPPRPSTRLQHLRPEELEQIANMRQIEALGLKEAVHGDLDWIVMKCLEKERGRRYETANGLAMDVERFLRNEPVLARPPTWTYQFCKFAQRNRVAVVSALAVTAALIAGTALSGWQAVLAQRARKQAEAMQRRAESGEQRAQQLLYSAKVRLAQTAWEEANESRLREMLADTQDSKHRDFEWRYWKRISKQASHVFRQPIGEMLTAAASPDGKTLATAGQDWIVRLWDMETDKEIATLQGHAHSINEVHYSHDGHWLASASEDQTVLLWEMPSGRLRHRLTGHVGEVLSVSFSPNDRRVVSCGTDGVLRVWDVQNGSLISAFRARKRYLYRVRYSPDGTQIAATGMDHVIDLYEASTGAYVRGLGPGAPGMTALEYSRDGFHLVSGHEDGQVRLWDTRNGTLATSVSHGTRPVTGVALSHDLQTLVSGANDRTVRMWDGSSHELLSSMIGHNAGITSVQFSSDDRWIISASRDGTARLWPNMRGDLSTGLKPHSADITRIAVSKDNRLVVSVSKDRLAHVYNRSTGALLAVLTGHAAFINGVVVLDKSDRIATSSVDGQLRLWNASSFALEAIISLGGATAHAMAAAPDGFHVALGCEDATIRIWNLSEQREERALLGHRRRLTSVTYSADGRWILSGSEDGTARLWSVADGRLVRTHERHSGPVSGVAMAPDGLTFATGGWDRMLWIWRVSDGAPLRQIRGHSETIWDLAYSPNGHRLASVGRDRVARLWDPDTGDELMALHHRDVIACTLFTPDGNGWITGSQDGFVRLWQSATEEDVTKWAQQEATRPDLRAMPLTSVLNRRTEDQQEFARLHGLLRSWVMVAPIPYAKPELERLAVSDPLVDGESSLTPMPGDVLKLGSTQWNWKLLSAKEGIVDVNEMLGAPMVNAAALAALYVRSDTVQSNVVLRVGNDDPTQIYLNGRLIFRLVEGHHDFSPDIDAIAGLTLQSGTNVILLKSFNTGGAWRCALRLTDADGGELKGVSEVPIR